MKIFLALMFLLMIESGIIFMLIEKNKSKNIDKYVPGNNPNIPLTVVMDNSFKTKSVDTT